MTPSTVPDVVDPSVPDLADPFLYETGEPEAIWARLRARAPVHRNERVGGEPFWAVLSHRLAQRVLRDPATFSSAEGMRLDSNREAVAAANANRMLIVTDPPEHTAMRRVLAGAFTPRLIRRLEETMAATVEASLDAALAAGGGDFLEVAARLPVSVICDMLGVPPADWDFMVERTMVAWGSTPADEAEAAAATEAHTDIMLYFDDLMARRRRDPQDDIVTALIHASVDGRPLSDDEILLNCDGIISGGNETTRHAALGGLHALITHPDQWERLRADAGLLPTAVQEVLRWTAPVMHVMRTATRDAEVGDVAVRAGDRVAVWLPAANRDGEVFAEPETFDVGREPNRHLTFAAGNHRCLGSALSASELQVLFGTLVRRVAAVEPGGPARRLRSNLVWGFASLPVRLTPAGTAA